MKIQEFKVERWMNDYEDLAKYNLGETCIDSLSVQELMTICGINKNDFFEKIANTRLTYSYIFGSPSLKEGIASLYQNIKPDMVIPTHGATGANQLLIESMVCATDNMVSVMPTYQQHYSIPESIGAEVRILQLKPENCYLPDIDDLKALVDTNTKLITFNNPNNPTGSWIPEASMRAMIDVARAVGAYVLCDEVYRGISEDGSYMHSVADLYEKGISVGSMSKVFSMAGVRMGWIVTKDQTVINEVLKHRDYNTISCGVLDDMLSSLALAHKEQIWERNRRILHKNREVLDQWVRETSGVHYVKPVAGTTALVFYDLPIDSYTLCKRLITEKGLLFTPGAAFEMEGSVRIGYAFDTKNLQDGLHVFKEFIEENS